MKNSLVLRISQVCEHWKWTPQSGASFNYYESSRCKITEGAKHPYLSYYIQPWQRLLFWHLGQRTDHLVDKCFWNDMVLQYNHEVNHSWHLAMKSRSMTTLGCHEIKWNGLHKTGSDGKLQWRPYAPVGVKRTKLTKLVHPSHQKYLKVCFDGVPYKFTCLPNGLLVPCAYLLNYWNLCRPHFKAWDISIQGILMILICKATPLQNVLKMSLTPSCLSNNHTLPEMDFLRVCTGF